MPDIGMSVPGASSMMDDRSLADQINGETEDQRRKRLQKLRAAQGLPVGMSAVTGTAPGGGYGSAFGMS